VYIGDYLARRCATSPDRTALVDVGAEPALRLSYRELNERADRLAHVLRGLGVAHGDRVALLAHDGVAHYDAFFACGKLGAALVPLNWRLHPREVEGQVRQTAPAVLLYGEGEPMEAAAAHLGQGVGLRRLAWAEAEALSAGAPASPVTCEAVTEADTACLLFTGGTTGDPKAAQVSHGQIAWNAFNTHLGDFHGTDLYLNIFPLFHTGGLFAFSVPFLLLGGTVVQTRRFEAEEVLRLVPSEGITVFGGVPTVFQMLAAAEGWAAADLSSLRCCVSGGAPMPVPLIRRFQREKGVVFRQGFGMTEFGPGVFTLPAADAERKAGSIGKPTFFVDARVVDPGTNRPLPPQTVGELVLRGPVATTGYFRDPEATAAAFDAEGYFHTGDLATVDEEGYFSIVGRLKEMFISGGENVYPAEVEAALYEHAAVAQCAVIGVEDARWGEAGVAFVVRAPGQGASEAELLGFLRDRLASYKVPKAVVFREALPVSGAGKILKNELREAATHA